MSGVIVPEQCLLKQGGFVAVVSEARGFSEWKVTKPARLLVQAPARKGLLSPRLPTLGLVKSFYFCDKTLVKNNLGRKRFSSSDTSG